MEIYLGIILPSALSFTPQNFMPCDGRLLPIQQYNALFALLGTTYGGDGRSTFALPDMRGRGPVGTNPSPESGPTNSPGVSNQYSLGQIGGTENVALTQAQMPAHTHGVAVANGAANQNSPVANYLAQPNGVSGTGPHASAVTVNGYANPMSNPAVLAADSVLPAGAGQPHPNLQPFLALNWIICVAGLFPSRP